MTLSYNLQVVVEEWSESGLSEKQPSNETPQFYHVRLKRADPDLMKRNPKNGNGSLCYLVESADPPVKTLRRVYPNGVAGRVEKYFLVETNMLVLKRKGMVESWLP